MAKHKVRKRTSYADPKDYIYDHVVVTEKECWEWIGCLSRNGYPTVSIKTKTITLSRFCYEIFKGIIPDGLQVLHTCDNPPCVNPDHLFLGTQSDNIQDMHDKNRHPRSKKLHPGQVVLIRQRVFDGQSKSSLARQYGVNPKTIREVCYGDSWQDVGGPISEPGENISLLNEGQVREIRTLLGVMPYTQIALKFGVSRRCIYDIRMGKTWKGVV
jgi:hypothetical protein